MSPIEEKAESRLKPWLLSCFLVFLPGALAGTQVAGLIFYLNPHLPFDLLPILGGVSVYGCLLGILGLLFMLPWTRGRVDRAVRLFPIALTVVLTGAGISAWIHASYFAFYLPPGINRRLLKAAIWLSLAALVCFYTALIHRVRRRPYGRRSLALFFLLTVASVLVVMERREAFRPSVPAALRPTVFQGSQRPLLCVVGIESATLDAILPLEEQGRLPFFGKMLREGAYSRLTSLEPTRASALWTTLATGKYPYRHGVVSERSFAAPFFPEKLTLKLLPIGIGFETWGTWSTGQRTNNKSIGVRTLGRILPRLEVPTALVGWPLAAVDEEARTVLTHQFFESEDTSRFAKPEDLAERARLFRIDIEDIDPAISARFGAAPPQPVLEAVAKDLWRRDLSTFILGQDPQLEALMVVFPGLADISRRFFGGFSAVQFDGEQDPDSVNAAQVISAYYTLLDDILTQLWEQGSGPKMFVVVSPYGAEGSSGWREARRVLFRQPAVKGFLGSDGLLMLLGDGFQQGSMRPADLVDMVPTVLYGLGFPIARDLDGAVLTDAFETGFLARQPLTFLPSYEALAERVVLRSVEEAKR